MVIANAGISVGMDTGEREDLQVMARTLATNVLGMAATFHPFIGGMRSRASGALVGIAGAGRKCLALSQDGGALARFQSGTHLATL